MSDSESESSGVLTIDVFMKLIYEVFLRTKERSLIVGNQSSHNITKTPDDFLRLAYRILRNVSIRVRCKYCIKINMSSGALSPIVAVEPYRDISQYGSDLLPPLLQTDPTFKLPISNTETDVVVLQHILSYGISSGENPAPIYVDNQNITTETPAKPELPAVEFNEWVFSNIPMIENNTMYIFVEYVKVPQTITIESVCISKQNTAQNTEKDAIDAADEWLFSSVKSPDYAELEPIPDETEQ